MSEPLKTNSPPEDVLPYAPNWARHPGYRPSQPGVSYDAFSEEENPSYRSMAQMFAPEADRHKKRGNNTAKMLLRFGAVVGVAGAALALFIGYVATQRDDSRSANAERFEGVSSAVAAIQAALSPLPAPAAVQTEKMPAIEPAPPVAAVPAKPEQDRAPVESKAANNASIATDRGAAPMPPPGVDTNLIPEPQPQAPALAPPVPDSVAPEIASLNKEAPPAPAPEPVAPQLSAGELATLMARGRRFMQSGDFSSARPVYRRAAEAGYAEAALALGETYDPATLAERGVLGMSPDVAQARHWYERARDLGSLEAPTRLERLPGN
jgi:hypothetical protein